MNNALNNVGNHTGNDTVVPMSCTLPGTRITTPTAAGWQQLWAQTHALRAAADLLDRIGLPGLALTIDDQITIQIPQALGDAGLRTSVCAALAAAIGTTPTTDTRPGATRGWVHANGHLAGHPIKIFTAIPHGSGSPAGDQP
jgi:hypothetical protein